MARRIDLIVNGKNYTVETADPAARPLQVTVNGRAYEVSLAEPTAEAPAAGAVGARPAGSAARVVHEVRAPMPGNVVDIVVQPGQAVEYGQNLCVLEAMKMKSAIRAPRAGVIAAVEVSEGQAVAHGFVLFRFE